MKPVLFLATTNPVLSRAFYQDKLRFPCTSDGPYAIVFDVGITTLRIQKVESMPQVGHTVLGWEISNLADSIRELSDRGIEFKYFPGLSQDKLGIWRSPDSVKVAWFSDPDGNILSLTEYCTP